MLLRVAPLLIVVSALFSAPSAAQSKAPPPTSKPSAAAIPRAVRDSMIWRRDDLLSQFEFAEDRVEGGGWFTHRLQVVGRTYDREYLKAALSHTGRVYLMSSYTGSSWIFHDRIVVRIGERVLSSGVVNPLSSAVDRDNGSGAVWEKVHFLTQNDGGILRAIARADSSAEIVVKQVGTKSDNTFDLSRDDRIAIAETVELGRLIQQIGRNSKASRNPTVFLVSRRLGLYFPKDTLCSISEGVDDVEWYETSSPSSLKADGAVRGSQADCAKAIKDFRSRNPR